MRMTTLRMSGQRDSTEGVTYTVELENAGVKGKGITNEDVTVSLALPPGAKVVKATGPYEGLKPNAETKSEAALWRVPRMAAGDRQTLTITLAQPAAALRGVIRWATPKVNEEDSDVAFAVLSHRRSGPRGGRRVSRLPRGPVARSNVRPHQCASRRRRHVARAHVPHAC